MNEKLMSLQRYRNGRSTLIAIFAFSVLNMFAAFAGVQFIYSSYIANLFTSIGWLFYDESKSFVPVVIFFIIALITLIPYLLAFIFSKKRLGWMIAGLVLFSLDFALFAYDIIFAIAAGEFIVSSIIEIIIRPIVLVELILAVVAGAKAKDIQDIAVPEAAALGTDAQGVLGEVGEAENAITRTVNVSRIKKLVGCGVLIDIFVDDQKQITLPNGEKGDLHVNGGCHVIRASAAGLESSMVTIPEGETDVSLVCYITMGKINIGYTK